MKVTTSAEPMSKFKPCSITLTFESVKEAAAIYAIFNVRAVVDGASIQDEARKLRESIREIIASQSLEPEFRGEEVVIHGNIVRLITT